MNELLSSVSKLRAFLEKERPDPNFRWTAVSLFSGAGLSDLGYALAGFKFCVHVEKEPWRARFGQANFPYSTWIVGDARDQSNAVAQAYARVSNAPLDLLTATPPCQGMSSSNPGRGRRNTAKARRQEERNALLLAVIPIALQLSPRIIVAENVRQILSVEVTHEGQKKKLLEILKEGLPDYELFCGVVQVADYGVPQDRRRAIVVAIRRDQWWLPRLVERGLLPWPKPTHAEKPSGDFLPWVTISEWFNAMSYENLDARSPERAQSSTDPLHRVPWYSGDRYMLVADIPPHSGRNAYQNSTCPNCGFSPVPEGIVRCTVCGALMRNRPYVRDDETGDFRLIKGFHSSYRRMASNRPAPTITTNSSHIGSDYKIHPWENRVLSARECADLQTVPRFYDWSSALTTGRLYTIRQVVGEAFPPYFTYLHGKVLDMLLRGDFPEEQLAIAGQRSASR